MFIIAWIALIICCRYKTCIFKELGDKEKDVKKTQRLGIIFYFITIGVFAIVLLSSLIGLLSTK